MILDRAAHATSAAPPAVRSAAKDMAEDDEPEFKRARLEGGGGGEGEEEDITLAVEQLQDVQAELDKVNDEASDRVLEVEREFNTKRRPIFEKRNSIIAGVEGFWRTAFLNHPALSTLFTADDVELLSYVTQVSVADFDDVKSGFVISFAFEEGNPFLLDAALTKEFRFTADGSLTVSSTAAQHDPIADFIRDDLWPNPLKFFTGQVEEEEEWMNEDEDEDEDEDEEDEYTRDDDKGDGEDEFLSEEEEEEVEEEEEEEIEIDDEDEDEDDEEE